MRIEQRLKQLAEGNPNYSLLWAQWEFDKNYYQERLIQYQEISLITVYMTHHIHPQ
ncbi:Uncharacterised protein [Enterobacter hormaechei]|nr:Uncharacterised protein [Enterobacter hormaechei]SAF29669.1 Uncharacterised protein [Enterobacter hormaechei]SAG70346.1 Uncharacterised protein [Enterobacter hormaechei]